MLLDQAYQSYISDNKKSKQTVNTLEEASKNQSFRILKFNTKRSPNFDVSQISTSMPLSQKNMLSFLQISQEDLKKQHFSQEQLFQELQISKSQLNTLKEENTKLRTKIQHTEKEFHRYESMIEDLTLTSNNRRAPNNEYQLIQLKKQLKEKTLEVEDKIKEIDIIKKNVKVCKMQELEVERKVYFEETLKMKHMLSLAQDQIQSQNLKLEKVRTLEHQLDIQATQMEKMETKHMQMQGYIKDCEQLIKNLRSQLKSSSLRNQLLMSKNEQQKSKMDHLRTLYNSVRQKSSNSLFQSKHSYEAISKSPSDYFTFPKDQIQFLLLNQKYSLQQFNDWMNKLKQTKNKQAFQALLSNEPLNLNEVDLKLVMSCLTNQDIFMNFQQLLGPYQSIDYSNQAQDLQIITDDLKKHKVIIEKYWDSYRQITITKQDVVNFIKQINLEWNQNIIQQYLLQIFRLGELSFNSILIQHIMTPFPQEDSFLRDLQNSPTSNQQTDNVQLYGNAQDEVIVKDFFSPDFEDIQFEQQLGQRSNKYVQENQIQEASEEEEVQSSINKDDNDNAIDQAYIESNQDQEQQESQSVKILNDLK